MNWPSRTSRHLAARICIFIAAAAVTALGCGWYFGTSDSVRFNSLTEREMVRLPPLPMPADETEENTQRASRFSEENQLWDRAEAAEKEGKLAEERELLREYLEHTAVDRPEPRRNSAIDRLDGLAALDRGSDRTHVQAYLNARHLYDDKKSIEEVERALSEVQADPNLKDNAAYLRAAELYAQDDFEAAAEEFKAVARKYPRSEKREASLFMSAVARMKTSTSFTPTSGDEAHLHEYGDAPANQSEVVIDDAWHEALAGFRHLLAAYPHGRYANDARGWIAYLMLRNSDRAGALAEYFRLLADKNEQVEAARSLAMVRHHANENEMLRVQKQLEREPNVALVYAYYEIFNYAPYPAEEYSPYEEVKDANGNYDDAANAQLDKQWQHQRASMTHNALARILVFSQRLLESYPNLSAGGGFALRAGQASLELDNNEAAAQFANRALASRLNDDERAQALWTSAVAEQRLHHCDAARKSLNAILRDHPKSFLVKDARRTLAIISEDEGDLDGALEQYIALDYKLDIAYFVDVFMTIEQLDNFIQRHPDSPKKNELTYALGVRYLRANRWYEARATLMRVESAPTDQNRFYPSNDCRRGTPAINCVDPKQPEYDSWEPEHTIITSQIVMRDIQTSNVLEEMEHAVSQAASDEATAEAMYQLASYQFEANTLLFYNSVAWGGSRYWNLSNFASEHRYRRTNEPEILFAYMQEHDTPARALKIYLEIVKQFPQTRAARDALYSAAVCHERLANFNPYWRDIYVNGLHAGARMLTYADVKAAYPDYQLPRGTSGWQPSTRTVNGGPGWAARPKYIPPPTRMHRLKVMLENTWDHVQSFWIEKGRRWLTLIVILVALKLTVPIAKQNRKLLRPKLARLRMQAPRVACSPPAGMFWSSEARSDRVKEYLFERGIEFWELARDVRSRPVLLRNVLSHSFLALLLISLFWTLHFG